MQHELKSFLKRIFKEDAESILRFHLNEIGLSNVDSASAVQRKKLASSLKSSFPYSSIAKTSILYAELLKILKLQVSDFSKEQINLIPDKIYYDEDGNEISGEEAIYNKEEKIFFENKEEYNYYRMEKQNKIVHHFWNNIDKSLTKFEVIFNLFWLKAGEAELRGVTHYDVMKITNRSLIGIRKDLEESFEEIKKQFEIKDKVIKKQKIQFHFKDTPELKDKMIEKIKKKRYFGEEEIIKEINEFWNHIDSLYDDFTQLFKITLNKEIELKKSNLDDTNLIKITEKKIIEIWSKIEEEYQQLKNKIETIQKESRSKLKND
jgi:hypothetical protein